MRSVDATFLGRDRHGVACRDPWSVGLERRHSPSPASPCATDIRPPGARLPRNDRLANYAAEE